MEEKDNELKSGNTEEYSNELLIADILNAKNKINTEKKVSLSSESDYPSENIAKPVNEGKKNTGEPKKKRRRKRNKKKTAFGLILFSVIVIVSTIFAVVIIKLGMEVTGLGRTDTELIIDIPNGATVTEISQILYENEVINYPTVYEVLSKREGADSYKAGKHKIISNMSYADLIETLQQDPIQEKISVDVTFPEGYTLEQCAARLEEAGVCRADEFIEAFNNSSFGYNFEKQIEDRATKYYKMEGYCFPDTYTFFKDSAPEDVALKIYANFAEKVNANMLGRMKELGLSLDDTIALASIVQAEAPAYSEMKKVSSVFWNRLDNPDEYPRLESDPTKKYAAATGINLYNSYESEGLPPGAICNPGLDAINAVLYPEDTDYYYFCSNLSTQEFFYATTLKQHERNLVEAGLV